MLLAMLVAAAVSFASTPMVKTLACKVGAIDVPKDNRRMHKVPISTHGRSGDFSGVSAVGSRLRRH